MALHRALESANRRGFFQGIASREAGPEDFHFDVRKYRQLPPRPHLDQGYQERARAQREA